MIDAVTLWGIVVLGIASLLGTYRLVVGPSIPDRVVAADSIFLNGVGITVLLGVRFGTRLYLDPALIIAVLFFIGTVAVAKFLLRGRAID